MEVKQIAALPEGLEVIDSKMIDDTLIITVVSTQAHPACPLCGTKAARVHSRYCRKLADLPCSGQHVRLLVQVRKCFCERPDCTRKIFSERLIPFVDVSARATKRLYQIVQTIATGGRLGVRVTDRLGIQTTRHTILRRIMALPTEPVGEVPQIGIDDFSFRRGRKFGTIIVDLQTHQVLDVLADRTTETSAAWMATHPELDIVSCDRGGDYAAATRKAAPQATESADRFHIMKNLTEAVELTLARCRAEIRKGAFDALPEDTKQRSEEVCLPTEFVSVENWKPAPDPCTERERLSRQAERQDRYAQVTTLRTQGLGNVEIAGRVGVTTRTLERWQKHGFPGEGRRRKRPSVFDPYARYVLSRWEQGCTNGLQIYQEIKEQGYTGTEKTVYRFLVPLRRNQRIIQKAVVPHAPLQDFSAYDAVWLFVRDRAKLDEKDLAQLSAICQASETARTTYQLVQEFRDMLHTRSGEKLDTSVNFRALSWGLSVTKRRSSQDLHFPTITV